MKVLLLGHKGYLGSYLKEHIECDIEPISTHYDFIINCIGKPDVDFCEANPEVSLESNCNVVLPYIKSFPDAKLINFSSYYVYNDIGYCKETSLVTSKYNYSKHKLKSELLTTEHGGVSFRIGKLFGHKDINKQNKLTEYIIKNDNLKLDTVVFNPTSLEQVLKVVKHQLKTKELIGVYNLSDRESTTHYEYGLFINQLLGNKKKIENVHKLNRSFDNYGKFCMDISKINSVIMLDSWKDTLTRYIKEIHA